MWVALQEAPQVARITLAGMVMTFPTPDSLSAITEGPDGNLWFTGDNGIGRITPQGSITRFHAYGGRITNARDGNLWFTDANRIGRITPEGAVTYFDLRKVLGTSSYPLWIRPGPTLGPVDLWFTAITPRGSVVARISTSGKLLKVIRVAPIYPSAGDISTGPDGNIWFTEGGSIGRISPTTGHYTRFRGLVSEGGITTGPDRNLWFASFRQLGRITPQGTVSYFDVPGPRGGEGASAPAWNVVDVATGPDGKIWYTTTSTPNLPGPTAVGNLTPPKFACVVPNLRGGTLARARRLAHRAGCQLGTVTLPPRRHRTCILHRSLIVASQNPRKSDARAPGLTPVSIRLACPTQPHPHVGRG